MDTKYKNNYLTQVIARIDFLNPITSLNDKIPAELNLAIKRLFPIAEPQDVIARELQIKPSSDSLNRKKLKDWNFYEKKRNKHLHINYENMFIVFKIYESFGDFKTYFIDIVDSLFKEFGDLQIKRLGLRYINNVEISNRDPFNWKNYLNKNLLSIFNIPKDKTKITRAFHILEINYDDFNLRFQYGMHNPDFPAPIKKKIFILDYDAYCSGILTKDEIFKNLPIFHAEIQRLFESSITDKLRMKLNEEK